MDKFAFNVDEWYSQGCEQIYTLPDDVISYHINPYLELSDSLALREALRFKIYIKRKLNPAQQIRALTLYAQCSSIFPKTMNAEGILDSYAKCLCILKDLVRLASREQALRYFAAFQESIQVNKNLIQTQIQELNAPYPCFISTLPQTKVELELLLDRFTQLQSRLRFNK